MLRRLRLSPSMGVALLALFVALGGTGLAATNGNFILGNPNSADQTTALTANPVAGAALAVTNSTPKQPAAAFTVNGKAAPFTVSSSTRVGKLNSDLLDGIDSSGFVQGANTEILTERKVTVPTNTVSLFTMPGFGLVYGSCKTTSAAVGFQNTSGGNLDFWAQGTALGGTQTGTVLSSTSTLTGIVTSGSAGNAGTGVVGFGFGNDSGPRSVAVLHVYAYQSADGAPCGFQAQATVWHS